MNQTALDAICARYKVADLAGSLPLELAGGVRADLPHLFRDLGYTVGAEIGVWQGEFSEALCQGIPDLHLFAVDPWVRYKDYHDYELRASLEAAREMAMARLAAFRHVTIIPKFSLEAAEDIPDNSLDFVYIDANHGFEYVVADLAAWTKKVKPGGIISGHDYVNIRRSIPGFRVVEAVQGWTRANDINPWFILGRTKVHPDREPRDKERSYLWVKP
jgi:hypothetical protein